MAKARPSRRPGASSRPRSSAPFSAATLNATVRPFLSTIVEIHQLGPDRRPPAEIAHREIRTLLEETLRAAGEAGLPGEDQTDLRFALVAFADEMMQLTPGRFQEFWTDHMLQEAFFGKALAGDAFYERMSQLRTDEARYPVLLAYYLCMLFGYRGKYRGTGELAFENLVDDVRRDLQEAGMLSKTVDLAPEGARPNELAVDGRRNLLLQSLAIVVAVLSVVLYVGFWLVIDDEAVDIRDLLKEQQRQISN